jgi:hypothetical protein
VNKRKEGEEETRDRRTGSSDWGNTITKQKGSQVREFRKWTSIEVADVPFLDQPDEETFVCFGLLKLACELGGV